MTCPECGNEPQKLLFRAEEAAAMLGIGRSRLYVLLKQKKIRSITIGKSRRIPREALAEFIACLEAKNEAAT